MEESTSALSPANNPNKVSDIWKNLSNMAVSPTTTPAYSYDNVIEILRKVILETVNGGSKDPYFHDPCMGKIRNIRQAILITGPKDAFIIQEGPLETFKSYLEIKNTWYIVDGISPKDVAARIILLCSTRKEYFHEYRKFHHVDERVMPVWTEEEIEECRNQLYNNLSTDLVVTVYGINGEAYHVLF
ncbi:1334_t:CDS:2 [Ambispora leptoticha]|uniref:1334_t:CDS:1 n=1 Tax=Ambispora leptoticha TaxID=144679 RepID=A0A9N8V9I4_9GLOM|nr:1334_t:CDS:2 [Ambispora leptoticha]